MAYVCSHGLSDTAGMIFHFTGPSSPQAFSMLSFQISAPGEGGFSFKYGWTLSILYSFYSVSLGIISLAWTPQSWPFLPKTLSQVSFQNSRFFSSPTQPRRWLRFSTVSRYNRSCEVLYKNPWYRLLDVYPMQYHRNSKTQWNQLFCLMPLDWPPFSWCPLRGLHQHSRAGF